MMEGYTARCGEGKAEGGEGRILNAGRAKTQLTKQLSRRSSHLDLGLDSHG